MKKTSLGRGTVYITISTIIFVASGYLINIGLGRYLGPSSYGIYGVVISLMGVMNLIQTSGLPQAASKFIAEDESNSEAILKTGIIIQIISTILASFLFFLLATPIAKFLKDTSLVPYLQTSALIFPFYGIYSLYLNYYNGLHYFKKQAIMNIIYALAKLVTVIGFVYFFHVFGAIFGFVLSPLIALLFFFHIPKQVTHPFPYKKLIMFSLPLIGVAVFSNLLQSIDLFFVKGLLQSNKFTGIYTANQNIAEIPFYGVTALASVLFPGISRSIGQRDHDRTIMLISRALRFSFLIITPSILLISATSNQILTLIYSSAYKTGAESLSILVIGSGFFTMFTVMSAIISGSGSPVKSSFLAGTGLLINSLLCFVLIPSFGLNGAAVSTTVAACIIMVISGIIIFLKFKFLLNIKNVLKIFSASLVIFVLAKLIHTSLILLPAVYIFFFVLYGAILLLLKEITKEDVRLVRSIFGFN